MHSESGFGVVLMPDMESGGSEAGDSHYSKEDVVYCGSDYGVDVAKKDEEAVLRTLTSKYPDLPLPGVEDLDVARFCEAKQDRPCHLRCPKHRAEGGKPPRDGDDHPMREEVTPAGLGGGDRAADVAPFPKVVEEMKVDEDPGLLPMVVPTILPPLPPDCLAGLPPHGAPLAEVQRLQENFDKLYELLTSIMGNIEKMNARVGELERKVQGSLPQVGETRDQIKALDARVRELELFKDTLPEFVHAHFNLRITEFQGYLVSHGFQPTVVPMPSTPPPTRVTHSTSPPSVPRPGPSRELPRTHVPPVPSRPAPAHLPDVAPGPAFAPSTPYNAPIDSLGLRNPSSSPTAPSWPKFPVSGPSLSTPTAYPRPDPQYSMYDPRPNGGYPPPYSFPGEESLGLLEFPVTSDSGSSPEAMVQPILHGSPSRAPAMPSPVTSSTVMTTSFPGAARIF